MCKARGAALVVIMTSEHLRPLLDNPHDMERFFWRMCQELARAETPDVVDAIRLGRITALSKPSGGVRGIVSGDIIRRLVARTVAQQLNPEVEKATAPFQFALTTRCGGECVARAVQALTDVDLLVLSVSGVSPFFRVVGGRWRRDTHTETQARRESRAML